MSLIIWRSREASDLLGHGNNRQVDIKMLWKFALFVITSYSTGQHRGELYLSILLTISDTDVSYMGSPSSLANPRAIFTACGTNTKLILQLKISLELLRVADYLCCLVVKQFVRDLRNPVVGAVSGHLAAYVEAFKDVESSDQGNASMWGRGHHHMVSYLKKIMMIKSKREHVIILHYK